MCKLTLGERYHRLTRPCAAIRTGVVCLLLNYDATSADDWIRHSYHTWIGSHVGIRRMGDRPEIVFYSFMPLVIRAFEYSCHSEPLTLVFPVLVPTSSAAEQPSWVTIVLTLLIDEVCLRR